MAGLPGRQGVCVCVCLCVCVCVCVFASVCHHRWVWRKPFLPLAHVNVVPVCSRISSLPVCLCFALCVPRCTAYRTPLTLCVCICARVCVYVRVSHTQDPTQRVEGELVCLVQCCLTVCMCVCVCVCLVYVCVCVTQDPTQRVEGELANRLLQSIQARERQRAARRKGANATTAAASGTQQPGDTRARNKQRKGEADAGTRCASLRTHARVTYVSCVHAHGRSLT